MQFGFRVKILLFSTSVRFSTKTLAYKAFKRLQLNRRSEGVRSFRYKVVSIPIEVDSFRYSSKLEKSSVEVC